MKSHWLYGRFLYSSIFALGCCTTALEAGQPSSSTNQSTESTQNTGDEKTDGRDPQLPTVFGGDLGKEHPILDAYITCGDASSTSSGF